MTKIPYISAREAVRAVRSGDHVHLSSVASVPQILIEALAERSSELEDVHFHHFHTEGDAPYAEGGPFFDQGFFVGPNVRKNVQEGLADYIPVNLYETQSMYRNGALACDVALVPAGGTYTMDAREAAAFVNALRPAVAIPEHYGTVAGSPSDGKAFASLVDPSIEVVFKL